MIIIMCSVGTILLFKVMCTVKQKYIQNSNTSQLGQEIKGTKPNGNYRRDLGKKLKFSYDSGVSIPAKDVW